MNSIQRLGSTLLSAALLSGVSLTAHAQKLLLVPSAFSGTVDTPITLQVSPAATSVLPSRGEPTLPFLIR